MEQHISIFKLSCRSCGANLEISPDIGQFACAYCGVEQIVEHRGGIVALRPISEAIRKVQKGTDKAAAELALRRLPKELDILVGKRKQREQYWQGKIAEGKGTGAIYFLAALFVSFLLIVSLTTYFDKLFSSEGNFGRFLGFAISIILSVLLIFYVNHEVARTRNERLEDIRKEESKDLKKLDEQIRDLTTRIENNRRIADS